MRTTSKKQSNAAEAAGVLQRLSSLLRSPAFAGADIAAVLTELSELAVDAACVARATVWQLTADGESLECIEVFQRDTRAHAHGPSLMVAAYPAFFKAIFEERVIAAESVTVDPRTAELATGYFGLYGTTAVMCAPVFTRARLVGAVFFEHAEGQRVFELWEQLLAGSIADLVAQVLLARENVRAERKIRETRARVDELLERRTNEVVRENADLQREVDALTVTTEAIKRSEDELRTLFDASPVPMLLVRKSDQTILLANEKSASALSCTVESLAGRPARELFAHRSDYSDLRAQLEGAGTLESVEVELRAGNLPFWALISARTVTYNGQVVVLLGFTDLTAQKAVEHQLRSLAQRDPLTQAYNRHHFWHLANIEMTRVARYNRPLTVAMLDADLFKAVNDAHGHDVGDLVLRMIVDTCQQALRKSDVLARYGGEELITMLPETTAQNATIVMERIRERIAQTPLVLENGTHVWITVSIGVAGLKHSKEPFEELLKRADDALYAAKRNGRNRTVIS